MLSSRFRPNLCQHSAKTYVKHTGAACEINPQQKRHHATQSAVEGAEATDVNHVKQEAIRQSRSTVSQPARQARLRKTGWPGWAPADKP